MARTEDSHGQRDSAKLIINPRPVRATVVSAPAPRPFAIVCFHELLATLEHPFADRNAIH